MESNLDMKATKMKKPQRCAGCGKSRRDLRQATHEIAATRAPFAVARAPVEVELVPIAADVDDDDRASRLHAADRLLLQLADIRRPGKSGSYDVYLALPPGARPDDHPDHLAGRISLYGPPPRDQAPPRVFHFVLDVSRLRATLAAALADRGYPLRVTIAPADDWSDPVTVGRVALHVGLTPPA